MAAIIDFFQNLFKSDFMPHGHCFMWQPEILWTHIISGTIIAISYIGISGILFYMLSKREDSKIGWVICFFATFFLCGFTHGLDVWSIYNGTYRLIGFAKILTAIVSVATIWFLAKLVPTILKIPTINQYELLKIQNERIRLETSKKHLREFAYTASHDMKEPLRTISSFMQLLKSRYGDKLDKDAIEFIDFAMEGSRQMKAQVENLLTFASLSISETTVENVHLEDIITATTNNLKAIIFDKNAEIICKTNPTLQFNHTQAIQLFTNLIGNAIKYCEKTPRIEISAKKKSNFWTIQIKDNGIGIPEEYREHIFENFKRLHPQDKYEGSGVGLAICRKIMDCHQGNIWAEENPEGGSIFVIKLPIKNISNPS